jgi:hypothetical protein
LLRFSVLKPCPVVLWIPAFYNETKKALVS